MSLNLNIDKFQNTPVYQQIISSVLARIEDGSLPIGAQLPSINKVANDYNLARETVVKAFKILQKQGTISPIQGKGYYISSVNLMLTKRIFLLFDTFSAYKEAVYNTLKDKFGANAFIDIYFHHFNFKTFEQTIKESIGNYQHYIIISLQHERLKEVLNLVPSEKLYLLDIKPELFGDDYIGVFQNFEDDLFRTLSEITPLCRKYKKLILVFRNQITLPPQGIVNGFERFCTQNKINSKIMRSAVRHQQPKKGEAYIVIDDEDLVYLAEAAKSSGFQLGSNFGILSYNETPLKKIASNGISVISTDFVEMGTNMAEMVINKQRELKYNTFKFIDRNSF